MHTYNSKPSCLNIRKTFSEVMYIEVYFLQILYRMDKHFRNYDCIREDRWSINFFLQTSHLNETFSKLDGRNCSSGLPTRIHRNRHFKYLHFSGFMTL